ncbi:MAG: hypothetical protein GDA54_02050 [Alphaproteobacteria bacterium GM7ARS4]|nr:hypothetical protein [Alphaproteobacteria bacterium GM7ARS4]
MTIRHPLRLALLCGALLISTHTPLLHAYSDKTWLGQWHTRDGWGSDYTITLSQNGQAHSSYGDGLDGTWREKDGGIFIQWRNNATDFLFQGVMGRQRLFVHPSEPSFNYSAGLQR